jgi:hypothetical protein
MAVSHLNNFCWLLLTTLIRLRASAPQFPSPWPAHRPQRTRSRPHHARPTPLPQLRPNPLCPWMCPYKPATTQVVLSPQTIHLRLCMCWFSQYCSSPWLTGSLRQTTHSRHTPFPQLETIVLRKAGVPRREGRQDSGSASQRHDALQQSLHLSVWRCPPEGRP